MSKKRAKMKRALEAEILYPNIGPRSSKSIHDFIKGDWHSRSTRPTFIIIDDMEDNVIDVTASELPKELEHHDHRD